MLPSRDIIAHSIELMAGNHQVDGLVLLGSCDKIVPGLLMAAADEYRNIIVSSGPNLPGEVEDSNPLYNMYGDNHIHLSALDYGQGYVRSGSSRQQNCVGWRIQFAPDAVHAQSWPRLTQCVALLR